MSQTNNPNQVKRNKLNWTLLSIATLFILLAVFIYPANPCPTTSQKIRALWSLIPGLICLGASLPGRIRTIIPLNSHAKIIANGASACFILIIILVWYKPAFLFGGSNEDCDFFTLTVFLEDENGDYKEMEGTILIILGSKPIQEVINTKGEATFKEISGRYKGDSIWLRLRVNGWQFINGSNSIKAYVRDDNSIHLGITRSFASTHVFGTVIDESESFVDSVRISIGPADTLTDSHGWFDLNIPKNEQAESIVLTASKNGYINWENIVYPALGEETKIVLKRR